MLGLYKAWQITEIPVSTDLINLADTQNKIEVRLVPMRVTHGALWRIDNEWVIHINENLPLPMRRVTLFHEAFHILARANSVSVINAEGHYYKGRFNEILADMFAMHVLIPENRLWEEWQKTRDIQVMSDTFKVPQNLMAFCVGEPNGNLSDQVRKANHCLPNQ